MCAGVGMVAARMGHAGNERDANSIFERPAIALRTHARRDNFHFIPNPPPTPLRSVASHAQNPVYRAMRTRRVPRQFDFWTSVAS